MHGVFMVDDDTLFGAVLLVEDEPGHALIIQRALKGLSQEIRVTSSITEAIRYLKDSSFDLIVSDLNLPDLRGDEVVRSLKAVAREVPILVLTSSATVSDGVAAMRAGARDFLIKNFDSSFRDVLSLALSRLADNIRSERERAQVLRDRDLLREALENSADGLAVAHRDGSIRYCNSGFDAFLTAFGGSGRDILSIRAQSMVRGEGIIERLKERLLSMEPGGVWTVEVARKDGDPLAFDLSVSAVRDGLQGTVFILWARDVRERRRREQFQRDVFSTTTHDLKGPLGAIAVSCDLLLDRPVVDDRISSVLERISISANSAMQLIEEFLSMRRIEEGALVLRPSRRKAKDIVARAVESFSISAKTRSVSLSFQSEEEDPSGCIDPLAFERVVSNLVSNAIKFSRKGGNVVVDLRRGPGGLVLSVRDDGVGMEPSDAQRLFNRFGRLAGNEEVPGSGLGLYIVKCIVSAHGGSIDLTSTPGRGTVFEVFFPDAPPVNDRGEVVCLGA